MKRMTVIEAGFPVVTFRESASGEIRIADKALNVPEAFGQAAARAAVTEPPPGGRHV